MVTLRRRTPGTGNNKLLETRPANRSGGDTDSEFDEEPVRRHNTRRRAILTNQETQDEILVQGDVHDYSIDYSSSENQGNENDGEGRENDSEEDEQEEERHDEGESTNQAGDGEAYEGGEMLRENDGATSGMVSIEASDLRELRPRKKLRSIWEVTTAAGNALASAARQQSATPVVKKETRGRKRKAQQSKDEQAPPALKKRQARQATRELADSAPPENPAPPLKRGRGRPRKITIPIDDSREKTPAEETADPAQNTAESVAEEEAPEDEAGEGDEDAEEDGAENQASNQAEYEDPADGSYEVANSVQETNETTGTGKRPGRPPGSGKKGKDKAKEKQKKKQKEKIVPINVPPMPESERKAITMDTQTLHDMVQLMGSVGWTGNSKWKVSFCRLRADPESGPLPVTQEGKKLWNRFHALGEKYMGMPRPRFPLQGTFAVFAQYAYLTVHKDDFEALRNPIRESVRTICDDKLAPLLGADITLREANARALLCEDLLRYAIPQAVALLEVAFMLGGSDEEEGDGEQEEACCVPLRTVHMATLNLAIASTAASWLSRIEAALAHELGYRAEYPLYRPELHSEAEREANRRIRDAADAAAVSAAAALDDDGDRVAQPATRRDARKRLRLLIDRVQDEILTKQSELDKVIHQEEYRRRRARKLLEYANSHERQEQQRRGEEEGEEEEGEEAMVIFDGHRPAVASTPARADLTAAAAAPEASGVEIQQDYALDSYTLPGLDGASRIELPLGQTGGFMQATPMITLQDSQEDEDDDGLFVPQHSWAVPDLALQPQPEELQQPSQQSRQLQQSPQKQTQRVGSFQESSQPVVSGVLPPSSAPPSSAPTGSSAPPNGAQQGGKARSSKPYSTRELGYIVHHLKAHDEPDLIQLAAELGRGIYDVAKRAEVIKNAARTLAIKKKQAVPRWARAGYKLPM